MLDSLLTWNEIDSIINVAVHLFSNRSQMTSKCGKNKEFAHELWVSVSLMFLAHFDVQLCDLLLNGPMATKNLFVLYSDQKRKKTNTRTFLVPHDCSTICAKRYFSSLSSLYTVSSKSFLTSFLGQSRIMAKHFAKQQVSYLVVMTHDDNCVKISCSIGILK